MTKAVYAVLFAALFMPSACTLMEMDRQNKETERRIEKKQAELQGEETQRTALLNQQKGLLAELESQQMTVSELSAKLDQLRRDNDRLKANSTAQQRQKERLDVELRKYQADVAALQNNDKLPDVEKTRRIEELKKQISAQLKLMLAL
jgi:septal ring factor EnvC (AmiA/AmiB activator)